jgi:geranylgeranyl diphosphate synthase type I
MQRYASDLDTEMRQVVDSLTPEPDYSVMARYAMGWVNEADEPYHQATGKRIRPIFLLLCAEAAGGDWRQALPAAAAVELLHNFSLIHDDIQDDSPIRHGRPTVWKIWGVPNAINAGDILFSLSFHALHGLVNTATPPETTLKVWEIFNKTNRELTRGQHLDMRFESQETVTIDEYVSMITGKSAALLGACAEIGALIATNDAILAGHYADFAINLGVAFQIRDDILGIWGDPSLTGKSAATDIISRKKSLPVLYGLKHSDQLSAIYQRETLSDADVAEAIAILDSHDAKAYTQSIEEEYYHKALESIQIANPQGQAAEWLREFVGILFGRSY